MAKQSDLLAALKRHFGHADFRPHQREVCEAMLAGRDVFAVLPTSAGKSLCYQLPAVMLQGVTIIIEPLVSLMRDQVKSARAKGIAATLFTSAQTPAERRKVIDALMAGKVKLLYLAPEALVSERCVALLKKVRIAGVVCDEAHCIVQHSEFRPDYLKATARLKDFGARLAAFTATATLADQEFIIKHLGMSDPFIVRADFDRAKSSL